MSAPPSTSSPSAVSEIKKAVETGTDKLVKSFSEASCKDDEVKILKNSLITALLNIKTIVDSRIEESSRGILSDRDILETLGKNVVIEPFNKESLGPNSYDVTLGEFYYEHTEPSNVFFNPDCPKHVARFWKLDRTLPSYTEDTGEEMEPNLQYNGQPTYGARQASVVETQNYAELSGMKVGQKYIVVQPGTTILAHTQEFIGGRNNVTTIMKARSSSGRSCFTVCCDAGAGDVGYVNRWTMEIKNQGPIPLILPVGLRVAQILFFHCGRPLNSYSERGGQYQTSEDFEKIKSSWMPTAMVPSKAVAWVKEEELRCEVEARSPATA